MVAESVHGRLLGDGDPEPVGVRNDEAASPFLLICDHAGREVPGALRDLGLQSADLDRHIAYDIGILAVSQRLADLLRAPLVFQRYSRLVVECNRRFEAEDSIALVSDGTSIPGNEALSRADRTKRIAEIAAPYHAEISRRLDAGRDRRQSTILVSLHSFTPALASKPSDRPWHVGLCFAGDDRFSRPVLSALRTEANLVVGVNEPYTVVMAKDYSIPIHGEERGLPYVEFEVRQDLIEAEPGQAEWAERLARVLVEAHQTFRPE